MRNIGKRCKKVLLGLFLTVVMCGGGKLSAVQADSLFSQAQLFSTPSSDSLLSRTTKTAQDVNWRKVDGTCYNGEGEVIPGAITWGIDISEWQGSINWSKMATAGLDFVFIRAGYTPSSGSSRHIQDMYYKNNIAGAQMAGIPAGAYYYSRARTTTEVIEDARYLISQVKGYKISYPLVLDLEDPSLADLSRARITNIAKAFCNEVKKAGYYPMIYSNTNWYSTRYYPEQLTSYDFWLAAYKNGTTGLGSAYRHTIWQATDGDPNRDSYSTVGLIPGIPASNSVDIDFGYVDYTTKIVPRYAPVSSYEGGTGPLSGWVQDGENTYYYVNGEKATGWKKIEGVYYRFDTSTGVMETNKLFRYSNGYICYVGEDGGRVDQGWVTYGDYTYYMKNGFALKGLQKIGNDYYCFHTKLGYRIDNTRLLLNGRIYYFGSDGVRFNQGWKKLQYQGKTYTYYFVNNPSGGAYGDGYAVRGWQVIEGQRYFFQRGTGALAGTRAESMSIPCPGYTYVFDAEGHYKIVR